MWNPSKPPTNPHAEEDDSWEVRAFAEDTADGTTWPPRSYTCTFCRREFRSAQALGGHMNVHRRDRARLHQSQSCSSSVVSSFPVSSPSMASEGLWFQLYQQIPNPNNVSFIDSISAHFSLWPYILPPPDLPSQGHEVRHRDQLEVSSSNDNRKNSIKKSKCSSETDMEEEEEEEGIDLELRLGQSRPPL